MVTVGYFLSSETSGPRELVRQAQRAEQAGFERLWISDHFHPWSADQGESPFVWSVIGALSQAVSLPITTAVTCPTMRMHPAIIAHAAATAAVQCQGRFVLGVGSGEALNEHIVGDRWPPADIRLSMLTEAVELIRALHRGGDVKHHGEYYTVENARIYTLPDAPVPIYVSAFGQRAAELAGRIGDGFSSVLPDPELLRAFRSTGGAGLPAQGGFKVCWAATEEAGVQTAHRLWAHEQLPGELHQILPTPRHFEQAASLVTREQVAQNVPCGPDLDRQFEQLQAFVDAGYDEVYVHQIGPEQEPFFRAWEREILPHAGELRTPVHA